MDMGAPATAIPLTALVTATLLVIAWQDWQHRRIANGAVLLILACALLRWLSIAPTELERSLEVHGINVLLALLIIIPGAMKSVLGAGDAKLLIALALFWPTDDFLRAFSLGVLALWMLCACADAGHRMRLATASNGTAARTSYIQQLTQRGLPLGTALALGALTTIG